MTLFSCGVCAQDLSLEALFQQLGSRDDYRADYVETKYLSLFDIELSQSGQLNFDPPETMVRRQQSPRVQTFTITPQLITIESAGETKQTAIDAVPEMQGFVVSMLAVLNGDIAQLKRYYNVTVKGSFERWVLELQPSQKELRRFVTSIYFSGSQGIVKRIRINEIDGDWSEMELTQSHSRLQDAG